MAVGTITSKVCLIVISLIFWVSLSTSIKTVWQ